jgi:hypothetical protein
METFGISHYAGTVKYSPADFAMKNKEKVLPGVPMQCFSLDLHFANVKKYRPHCAFVREYYRICALLCHSKPSNSGRCAVGVGQTCDDQAETPHCRVNFQDVDDRGFYLCT